MPLGNEHRVALSMEHVATGRRAWTIRNFRVIQDGGDTTPEELSLLYSTFADGFVRPLLPEGVFIVDCVVADSANPHTALATNPINLEGQFPTSKFFPIQTCALIRLNYSGMSSRHPGKWFQPYLPMWEDLDAYNAWFSGFQALAAQLFENLQSAFVNVWRPVIWHRATGTSSFLTTTPTAQSWFYTQRRRAKDLIDRTELIECAGPL